MTALEALRASTAWDHKWDLPLFPMHQNPLIYCAYAFRICDVMPGPDGAERFPSIQKLSELLTARETEDGWIGKVSHDELLGMAYLSKNFARRLVERIELSDGFYGEHALKPYFYRFPFFYPAVRVFAGLPLGFFSQLGAAASFLWNVLVTSPDTTSGILKLWLCAAELRKHPLIRPAVAFWEWRWTKRGFTPKTIFQKHYLTEVPVMAEIAPDHYR